MAPHPIGQSRDEAVELNADACLAVLTSGEVEHDEHAHARERLKQIGGWFDGDPVQVAALIDTLAGLDPLRRARRKAVLTRAWADLLPARRAPGSHGRA